MSICDEIRIITASQIEATRGLVPRNFYNKLDWSDRLIGILGPKGVGKTTLLLQRFLAHEEESLYFSLDHPLATVSSLFEIAQQFYVEGGRFLYFDEVHKHPPWSGELKNIYDSLPELKMVFSGSSAVHLHAEAGDLSRRASIYNMPILSFREYLEFEKAGNFPFVCLDDLLAESKSFAERIVADVRPMPFFKQYLKNGAYPFYRDGLARYSDKLRNTVLYTIENDLVQVHQLDPHYIPKLKKMFQLLASQVPFNINISAMSQSLEISRATTLRYLELLELGGIINLLEKKSRGYQKLTKPEKIYLANTNLLSAFSRGDNNVGTVRETFALSQLLSAGYQVQSSERGDFLVDGQYTFEIGGRNKTAEQIKGIKSSYVFRDDIEIGSGAILPLWLLGFLY